MLNDMNRRVFGRSLATIAALAIPFTGFISSAKANPSQRVFDAADLPDSEIAQTIIDWSVDIQCASGIHPEEVYLTKDAYKKAVLADLVDYEPKLAGADRARTGDYCWDFSRPTLLGMRVIVPGTALA